MRVVDMRSMLRDELLAWRARTPRAGAKDFVFVTREGKRPSKDNLRSRVIAKANVTLEDDGQAPLLTA